MLPRERARAPERKRTRNKNNKFIGYVHVYAHVPLLSNMNIP